MSFFKIFYVEGGSKPGNEWEGYFFKKLYRLFCVSRPRIKSGIHSIKLIKGMTMNLTKNEALILSLLTNEREMYGLEMVKKSDGKLKLGTIYVTLSRLEDKGFAVSRKEIEPSLVVPRRLYKITGTGLRVIRAWTAAMDEYHSQLYGVENEPRTA